MKFKDPLCPQLINNSSDCCFFAALHSSSQSFAAGWSPTLWRGIHHRAAPAKDGRGWMIIRITQFSFHLSSAVHWLLHKAANVWYFVLILKEFQFFHHLKLRERSSVWLLSKNFFALNFRALKFVETFGRPKRITLSGWIPANTTGRLCLIEWPLLNRKK